MANAIEGAQVHSHMYFYAEKARPNWGAEHPADEDAVVRKRAIADALLEALPALPALREPDLPGGADPSHSIFLYLSPSDCLYVQHDHVHWDIKYRSHAEQEYDGTMHRLLVVSRTLEEFAGFDYFEHGCQGLNERGDLSRVPDVLAGLLDVNPDGLEGA